MPALPREEELHRLLDRFESQPEGRLFAPLADCYRRMERLDEAYRICVDGLARHPRYSTGFVILGKIHLDRGEDAEARTAFETVLSIDPENLVALRQLAVDAESRGDREGAAGRWEQVLTLDPADEQATRALEEMTERPSAEDDGEQASPGDDEEPQPDSMATSSPDREAEGEPDDEEEPTIEAGAYPEPASDDDQPVLEKATEAEAAAPEVLTAMSRDDSLYAEGMGTTSDGGDEAETIITVTLADIYYEQGFKAKALEMYRTVLERHPEAAEVAGLGEKVEQIESEMNSLARRFQQSTGEAPGSELEELEARSPAESEGAEEAEQDEESEADDGVQKFRSWVERRQRPGS